DFIDQVDQNPEIKVLVFFNAPESFNDEQYDKYIYRIMKKKGSIDKAGAPCFTEKNVRFREINILNALIKLMANSQTIIVSGLQGTVVTPFVGAAMVADFRYASENAVFSMAHNRHGLHPSGGLPFFLSSYLHHSKALEILMGENIMAKEALDLGLINKLLPNEDFENQLIKEITPYLKLPICTIRDSKRLTNFSRKALLEYFEYEGSLLNL
ncbi:MAG: enoyl-CoA hydratase/isomerase family protein, partial [Bacteroidales bacterium]|nr:enoyl-CoA hydratase/isomerase family protein [Bacteroidales bacterium]